MPAYTTSALPACKDRSQAMFMPAAYIYVILIINVFAHRLQISVLQGGFGCRALYWSVTEVMLSESQKKQAHSCKHTT